MAHPLRLSSPLPTPLYAYFKFCTSYVRGIWALARDKILAPTRSDEGLRRMWYARCQGSVSGRLDGKKGHVRGDECADLLDGVGGE